jgi:lipid-binding SYLF domain-containing protein
MGHDSVFPVLVGQQRIGGKYFASDPPVDHGVDWTAQLAEPGSQREVRVRWFASSAVGWMSLKGGKRVKICLASILVLLVSGSAFAAVSKDEVKRLNEAAAVLKELRNAPDKRIPDELWERAQCVVVIPSMKKAAFIIGGEYGAGVMSCRRGTEWSAPIFMQLAKGSWGLQIGAASTDLAMLVMNQRGADKLLQDKVSLGADASVAAGPVGRAAAAATDAQMSAEMLAYSRSQGLFAGIDLSGGVLRPDQEANVRAYGAGIGPRDIVSGARVTIPPAARSFLAELGRKTPGVKKGA